MHSQLRERIRLMRARLDNAAPVAEIRAESQLFVTPAPVCDRLVMLAEISNRDHILDCQQRHCVSSQFTTDYFLIFISKNLDKFIHSFARSFL